MFTKKPCPACRQLGFDTNIALARDSFNYITCAICKERLRWTGRDLVSVMDLPLGRKMEIFKGKGAEDVRKILWILATHEPLSVYGIKKELGKNYSIAYRTLKRLLAGKFVKEVDRVAPRKQKRFRKSPKLISIYGLTEKGAVATLLCFPTEDYPGLKSFVERWSEESILLDLIKHLIDTVPSSFIRAAIIVPLKTQVLNQELSFLNEIDYTIWNELRNRLISTFSHTLSKKPSEAYAILKHLRHEEVQLDLWYLNMASFVRETVVITAKLPWSKLTSRESVRRLRTMIQLRRCIEPPPSLPKNMIGSILDRITN